MKFNVVKDEANELVIEFEEKDYTVPDLIASELVKEASVEFAGVAKEHPQIGKPRLVIKTKGKKAKDVLLKAIEAAEENIGELGAALSAKQKK